MSLDTPCILVVDDEPINIEILLEYLEDTGFETETANDGQEAWEKLQDDPHRYDVVVLDRMMPRMSGLELLGHMKGHPVLQSIPVILQTAMAAKDEILEGMQAGAYYYLTKPFEEELLRSVLDTAVDDRKRYLKAQRESEQASRSLGLMREGRFCFRTLEAARDLATLLANACPEPLKVVIGMSELMINAVEHGNLAISYEEKTTLRENEQWEEEVARRLENPQFIDREVQVTYRREQDRILVNILDQGDGFDWQKFLEFDPTRAMDTHGRGIAMSKMISFDAIEYRGKGNEVEVTIRLDADST